MEKVLEKAIKKAKAYGLPMVVYKDNKAGNLNYCSLDVFEPEYYNAIYVVLSDGTHEKIGTANIHHG